MKSTAKIKSLQYHLFAIWHAECIEACPFKEDHCCIAVLLPEGGTTATYVSLRSQGTVIMTHSDILISSTSFYDILL